MTSRTPNRTAAALRWLAVLAALLAPGTAFGDDGPFPACGEGSSQSFCVGDIDFTSLVVTTDPPHPTWDQPVRLTVSALESDAGSPCHGNHIWSRRPAIVGRKIVFEVVPIFADCTLPLPDPRTKHRVTRTWDLGVLAEGVYTVQFRWDSDIIWAESRFEVHVPTPALDLHHGLFVAYVDRGLPGGGITSATAVPLTEFSGYFTFFEPQNVELTIKILDGRPINGHYWVFIASMTDRPFELTVIQNANGCLSLPTDPKTVCPWRSYAAGLGRNQNFIDVEFPLQP